MSHRRSVGWMLASMVWAAVIATYIIATWAGLSPLVLVVLAVEGLAGLSLGVCVVLLGIALLRRNLRLVGIAVFIVSVAWSPIGVRRTLLQVEEWVAQQQVRRVAAAVTEYTAERGHRPDRYELLMPTVDRLPRCWGFPPCSSRVEIAQDSVCLVQGRGWYSCTTCVGSSGEVESRFCYD